MHATAYCGETRRETRLAQLLRHCCTAGTQWTTGEEGHTDTMTLGGQVGRYVDGVWNASGKFASADGVFRREPVTFRDELGSAQFPAEPGRYHLYYSLACPWAHRVLVVRALLGLEEVLPASGVEPLMLDEGWRFSERWSDPVMGAQKLGDIYIAADSKFTGRVTVPVLFDTQKRTIVNNESSEIIRFLNRAFGERPYHLYPRHLRAEIDTVNARVYATLNNGVYRTGFARTQEAYEEAITGVFGTLEWLEDRMRGRTWLVGETLTEADIRLFTTLVRFDAVYHYHFKCNRRRLTEFPRLQAHTQRVFDLPGVAETYDLAYTKEHYFGSHRLINPTGVVPSGPDGVFGA